MRSWITLLFLLAVPALGGATTVDWQGKVDPWVLEVGSRGPVEYLVVLSDQADLTHQPPFADREARIGWVVDELRRVATSSQAPLLAELAARGVDHRPYWVANLVWVRSDLATAAELAARPDVARLAANPHVVGELPQQRPALPMRAIEGGIAHVGAPDFWALGIDGTGVVIGGQDTGYDWDHPALEASYRGWDGATADHDYNWHDAIHSGGGICGPNSVEPCDDHGHGTHTMGTMVGDDGGSNQIGMAPGARWIGCRNMDQGDGTPATYTECFQWFMAPTRVNGLDPDPGRAPHVINNSWGCPPSEGCTDPTALQLVVENVTAAGILVVVSAGNSGSSCGTVSNPPAIYEASLSVGATSVDANDTLASFSSRGPVTVDGSNRLKPDVAAPGVSIRSSVPGGGYSFSSGTSMAGPHVAGLAALLVDAADCFAGQPGLLRAHIEATALPRSGTTTCGGIPPDAHPNPHYGYGAIRAVLPTPDCRPVAVHRDGFESGDLGGWSFALP